MNWDCPQIDDEGEFGSSRLAALTSSPETHLVAQVLYQSIRDATTAPGKTSNDECSVRASDRNRRRALDWVYSHRQAAFSFEWCCSVLELDPEAVRERIRRDAAQVHVRLLEAHLYQRERGGRHARERVIGEEAVRV